MDRISPPLRKALALTLLFAVIFLIVTRIIGPVADSFREQGDSIERSRMLLGRYDRLLAQRDQVNAQWMAAKQAASQSGLFLDAPNDELAAASMQARIGHGAQLSGVRLSSLQMLPPTAENGMTRVGARVAISATPAGLTRFLHNLETSQPYLFVDGIRIRLQGAAGRGQDTASAVQAQFDIFGYNLVGKR